MSLRLKIPNSGLLPTTREGKGLRLDLHRVVVCAGRLGDVRSLEGDGAGDGPAGGRNLKFNRQDGGKQQRLGKGRGDLEPPPEAWGETDGLSLLPSMASLLLEGGRNPSSGHVLSFWDCYHSSPSEGGETESQRA